MSSEYNVKIWSVTEEKWVDTYIYFPDEPAQDHPSPAPGSSITIINEVSSSLESLNFEPTSGYQELTPTDSIFPTKEVWYTSSDKIKKIVEKNITWSGVVPTVIVYNLYAADGVTISPPLQDTISHPDTIFKPTITRVII
jgi:hypothetical protein